VACGDNRISSGIFRVFVGPLIQDKPAQWLRPRRLVLSKYNRASENSASADLSFLYEFVCECPNPKIADAMKRLVDHWMAHGTETPQLQALCSLKGKLSNEELIEVSWLLAINPNTPPSVLQDLCSDAPTALLERIAENSRTGESTLADLSYQAIAEIRIATAGNSQTPLASIMMLIQDDNPDVRYSMAENSQIPGPALAILAQDDNPFVKFRAEKTIARIADQKVESNRQQV
jgi:hypothetical protein